MAGGGEDSFVQPLGLLLGATAVVALLLSYARQSTIVAFIAVGVGVSAAGVEVESTTLQHISEVGILILLFTAGLEVELDAFLAKWRTVTIVGVGQVVSATGFFALASVVVLPAVGATVDPASAVYFGLCMCFSSTILVLGYLKRTNSMGTVYGQLCLGTLVLQDAASVLGIAVLGGLQQGAGTCVAADDAPDCADATDASGCAALGPACAYVGGRRRLAAAAASVCADVCGSVDLSSASADDGGRALCEAASCVFAEPAGKGIGVEVALLFAKLVATIFVCWLLNRFVLDRVFEAFARSLELLYLGSLGYATGLAAIAVTAGFSGEITAFLAGVSIAQLPYKMHIETKMEPIKSLGVAIFFISLGLKLEIDQRMLDSLPVGLGLAVIQLVATLPLFMGLGVLAGLKAHNVFMLGLLMNQISEFSLILCTLCVRAEVFEPIVLTVMTVAAVLSIVVSSMGHAFVDQIYDRMRRWPCLVCVDNRHRRRNARQLDVTKKNEEDRDVETGSASAENGGDDDVDRPADFDAPREEPSLHCKRPSTMDLGEEWAFEDQLRNRSTEQLEIDLKSIEKELDLAREAMAATADEKRRQKLWSLPANDSIRRRLYGGPLSRSESDLKTPKRTSVITTSLATDIRHGMIEGYVVVDLDLTFCTLRAGRMLFWRDQADVGHAPPISVWDVSGMAVLSAADDSRTSRRSSDHRPRSRSVDKIRSPRLRSRSVDMVSDDDDGVDDSARDGGGSDDDKSDLQPWEWTIVLGHIHRHTRAFDDDDRDDEDDDVRLAIHGLEDHSDHDAQDWQDALSVATATLNPIALRLALVREELTHRDAALAVNGSFEGRRAAHDHRHEIICVGYNETFPAVLALADAIRKDVVVVEYDPMKINTVKKLYGVEARRREFLVTRRKERVKQRSFTPLTMVDDSAVSGAGGGSSQPSSPRSPAGRKTLRSRSVSMPAHSPNNNARSPGSFFAPPAAGSEEATLASSEDAFSAVAVEDVLPGLKDVKGVACEYADVHDPECWEELEMDRAFMLVFTMKGARHAEKAVLRWLKRRESATIYVGFTRNNVEAIGLYKAGAHFVMQSDALAMRSTRDIFLETVANVGDCSQLVAAGSAHRKRLVRLEKENGLKFQYETG